MASKQKSMFNSRVYFLSHFCSLLLPSKSHYTISKTVCSSGKNFVDSFFSLSNQTSTWKSENNNFKQGNTVDFTAAFNQNCSKGQSNSKCKWPASTIMTDALHGHTQLFRKSHGLWPCHTSRPYSTLPKVTWLVALPYAILFLADKVLCKSLTTEFLMVSSAQPEASSGQHPSLWAQSHRRLQQASI